MILVRKVLIYWVFIILFISVIPNMSNAELSSSYNKTTEQLTNPFKIYYSAPDELTDIVIDSMTNIAYIGCEYGLIIKDLNNKNGEPKVLTYFNGLNDSYIEALELDQAHSRLFVIVKGCNDIFILNLTTFKIDKKYHLHSDTTMVDSAEFKHLYYDSFIDMLYLAEDSGLAVVNLSSGKFDFYDLFFFDVNFSKYEIKGNTVHAEINELFSINGLDYNPRANELYIATSAGLTIFNTHSKEFKNFRATSSLGNEVSDVLYIEHLNKLFMGGEHLIGYDVVTRAIIEYPRISWEFYPDNSDKSMMVNQSIRSLCYDPEHQVIFAILNGAVAKGVNHGWYGIAILNPNEPKIIRKFVNDEYKRDDSPVYSSFNCMYYNDADKVIYLGFGEHVDSGSKWIIDYTIEKSGSKVKSDNMEYLESITNKRLEVKRTKLYFSIQQGYYGGILYSYDFTSNQFEKVGINNSLTGDYYELYNRVTMQVHPETGLIFLDSTYNTLLFNSNLTIFKTLDDLNIYDIEFIDNNLVYLATNNGLMQMDMKNGSFIEINDDNISDTFGLDKGEISENLFISTSRGIVKFDYRTNLSSLYPFPSNFTNVHFFGDSYINISIQDHFEPSIRGIAVNKIETLAYLSIDSQQLVLSLNLVNGNFKIINASAGASKQLSEHTYMGLWYGIIETRSDSDEVIIATNMGLVDENIEFIEGFPRTGTINSFFIDESNNKLYAITGEFFRIHGGGRQWSSEFISGLIIFDLKNKTWVNYSIDHGLPSDCLSGVTVDSVRGRIYITGERFFSVIQESDLSKNITRRQVPTRIFEPTETDGQVLGFKGEEDYTLIYIGITGLSLGTIIGFLFFIEPTKYKLMVSFVAPLYSRLKKGKILDHETRGRIREKIESEPGIHYNELKKKLKLNNGALSYHLHVLERENLVKFKNSSKYKYFFPGDMSVPKKFFKLNELQKIIFKTLIKKPGISQKNIAEEIGSSTTTVNYNINMMEKKGIVELKRKGNVTNCFIIGENN